MKEIRSICVYCASSPKVDEKYFEAAGKLGKIMAEKGITIIYGGGAVGLMGKMADEALVNGGKVIGIMPHFMKAVEWDHQHVTELQLVPDMHARKKAFLDHADAVIALPGGCGTLEELLEAITWKRLGLITEPIIIVNIDGFYDHLIAMLDKTVQEKFMNPQHMDMWTVVSSPEEVLGAIAGAAVWPDDAISNAAVK